jgi:putative chitinase
MQDSGIVTPARIGCFVGQVSAETGFVRLRESMLYNPVRLTEVWPRLFRTWTAAVPYAWHEQGLANKVYAGVNGNGNEASGDGYRFRGGGLMQLTGRALFAEFGKAFKKDAVAAALWSGTPPGAAASACWYWSREILNALADVGDVAGITRRINHAGEAAAAREAATTLVLVAMGAGPMPPAPATADALMLAEQAKLTREGSA